MNDPKFAIIGCGLIGRKRLASLDPGQVIVVCDTNLEKAASLTGVGADNVHATTDVLDAINHPTVDAVIVATTNNSLADITEAAVHARKAVLVEKPAALSGRRVEELILLSERTGVPVRVGYNHRYHPALRKAHALLDHAITGPAMFIRGRYGHGGRIGYEKEWRADPTLAGGGELIDQGVHLIDLASWFLGEFTKIDGHVATYYWNMPVEDNAFVSLRTADGRTAWLQASCTEWKNLFSFEIYCRNAKLHIEGLGGNYGVERLSYYQMHPTMGPPETTIWEFPGEDTSWKLEMSEFIDDIRLARTPVPGLAEARRALNVVEAIYRSSRPT
jgi:predicted dehydrogenase